ncbi:MAG: hypothetical protein GSR80_000614 [Desulfurococcales archaeon]|nr:hypothetical protein [Desulfurococcales archaeon]
MQRRRVMASWLVCYTAKLILDRLARATEKGETAYAAIDAYNLALLLATLTGYDETSSIVNIEKQPMALTGMPGGNAAKLVSNLIKRTLEILAFAESAGHLNDCPLLLGQQAPRA